MHLPCDYLTYVASTGRPLACHDCHGYELLQLPERCTYQDTIMGLVNDTLENVAWQCEKCEEMNEAVHAWCQKCQHSRTLASITPPAKEGEGESKGESKGGEGDAPPPAPSSAVGVEDGETKKE